jgi:gliding motility-associated lipoprotein GldH
LRLILKNMMVHKRIYPLLGLFLSIFIACKKENIIFEKNYDIKNAHWTYTDTLDFAFDIADTMALYDMVLTVQHTPQYPLQNLYTNIYTKFPTGERIKQLLNIDMADNTGKWVGDCNSSECNLEIPIQENAFFNIKGQHIITLEQYMRIDSLSGIQNISFKIIDKGVKRDLTVEQKSKNKK